MSDVVEQIAKLEQKAHALKESVSTNTCGLYRSDYLIIWLAKILRSFEEIRWVDRHAERDVRR